MVGAIEVYSSSERPVQFGPGREERPLPIPGSPPPTVDVTDQQCGLVVLWTKARLGLLARDRGRASGSHSDVNGEGVFPTGPSCGPPSPIDTTDVAVYATLNADRQHPATDTSWSRYAGRVLTALRGVFVMPSALPLPAFGYPLRKSGRTPRPDAGTGARPSLDVEPTLSAVASFALDSSGQVADPQIAVSSMSGAADTSLLAAIAEAGVTHGFPSAPTAEARGPSTRFDLIVSTVRPAVGDAASLIGRITVPIWPLTRRAALSGASQPNLASVGIGEGLDGPGPRLEFVVNAQGHAAMPTVRAIGVNEAATGTPERDRVDALARALPTLQFEPARVGTCPVSQLISTGPTWTR